MAADIQVVVAIPVAAVVIPVVEVVVIPVEVSQEDRGAIKTVTSRSPPTTSSS